MAMNPDWTKEEDSYLSANFPSENFQVMASHLGRTISAIRNRAYALHLLRLDKRIWSEEDKAFIAEHYASMPNSLIAAHLGRPIDGVRMQGSHLGIRKRGNYTKYSADHASFDSLNPGTAYTIGMILSDGNISPNIRFFSICNTDRSILVKIRAVLGSTSPISENKIPNRLGFKTLYNLRIGSPQMTQGLVALGITPRKSLTATMPTVPDLLFFHFLRGFFDGDGCAHFSKKGNLALSMSSSSQILPEQLSSAISRLSGLPEGRIREMKTRTHPHWQLFYHGLDALSVADRMYVDAGTLYIERKRESIDRFRRHLFARE